MLGSHWAFGAAASDPLGRSKQLLRSHWALETAVPEPLAAQNGLFEAIWTPQQQLVLSYTKFPRESYQALGAFVPLGARKHHKYRENSRKHSKQLLRSHWALETAVPEPLGAGNSCSRAPECSKQPLRSHWALETVAPEPLGARISCSGSTVRSKQLLRSHRALEIVAPEPLGARNSCS